MKKMLRNYQKPGITFLNIPEGQRLFWKQKAEDYDPFLSIQNDCKNNNNIDNITYSPFKNLKNKGRSLAQSVSRRISRGYRRVLRTIYQNVDMSNAHPPIFLQYYKKKDIKCDSLDTYMHTYIQIYITFVRYWVDLNCDILHTLL